MSGWKPIETAPKDGTRIIAALGEDGVREVAFTNGWWHTADDMPTVEPTHWMPLPSPPEAPDD